MVARPDTVTTARTEEFVLVKAPLKRVRVAPELQQVVVSERRTGAWWLFWICFLGSAWAVYALAMHLGQTLLMDPLLILWLLAFFTPAFVVGAFMAFPHVRLVISQPDCFCEVQRCWLFFAWSRRTFPLDVYRLGMGWRHLPPPAAGSEVSLVKVIGWLVVPWWASFLTRLTKKKKAPAPLLGPRRPTVCLVHLANDEVQHLITLEKATAAAYIVESARDVLPQAVLAQDAQCFG